MRRIRGRGRGSTVPIWLMSAHLDGRLHGMKTTIDKAGRVVIPASLRERLGLRPGTELDVVVDDLSIRLVRLVPGPKLVRVGNRWVARPTVDPHDLPPIDLARLVDDERDRWPL